MTNNLEPIKPETILHIKETALHTEVDGEVVLMELNKGSYYALDPIASDVWSEMKDDIRFDALLERLCSRYDGDPEVIGSDLKKLVQYFSEIGVITLSNE